MNNQDTTLELEHLRHTCAHLLAAAVLQLYPDAKPTIGPAIENGFYYDFDFPESISSDDLPRIEQTMKELLKKWTSAKSESISSEKARERYCNNPYKSELIEEIIAKGEPITLYTWGDFTDLCRGGHLESASLLQKGAFTLTHLAGAYWRGSEKNKMLTRVYGLAFFTQKELDDYVALLEEAKKRDHKKLGKELDLFFIDEEVGQGLPIWTPKGTTVKHELEKFTWEIEEKYGYQHVSTPYLGSERLYQTSGHLSHYRENMYAPIDMDGEVFYLRPMACPHHIKIFTHKQRSYRELPIRYAEICDYNRYEKSGELMGMIRVRKFQLTDSHIFVTPDGLRDEFKNVCQLIDEAMSTLGIKSKVTYRFSKRDPNDKEKYYPDDELWNKAENTMKQALDEIGLSYNEAEGEAAFYGPKLDVQFRNVNGKEDTIITAQIDFLLPEKFNLSYIDEHGEKVRPVMIHRSVIGALERTFAYLIEHYAGAFPLWLAPVQVLLVSVGLKHSEAVEKLRKVFVEKGIRAHSDISDETVGNKIRKGEGEKVPYIVVVGDKEIDLENVAVRKRGSRDIQTINTSEFVEQIQKEVVSRQQ